MISDESVPGVNCVMNCCFSTSAANYTFLKSVWSLLSQKYLTGSHLTYLKSYVRHTYTVCLSGVILFQVIQIGNASILSHNLPAINGYIHVIDKVWVGFSHSSTSGAATCSWWCCLRTEHGFVTRVYPLAAVNIHSTFHGKVLCLTDGHYSS